MRTLTILLLVTASLAGCTGDDTGDDLESYLLQEDELPEGAEFGPPESDAEQPQKATASDMDQIRNSMEQVGLEPDTLLAVWSEFIQFGPQTQTGFPAVSVSLLHFSNDTARDDATEVYLTQGDAACEAGQGTVMFHDPQILLSLHGDPQHVVSVADALTDKTPDLEEVHRQVDCGGQQQGDQ